MFAQVEVDEKQLARLVLALRAEADGKDLDRDLARNLRTALEPARDAARAAIMAMPSKSQVVPSLRAAVAEATVTSVRLSGQRPGVAIRTGKTGMPRGFTNAPQRLNRAKGWRHPVRGTDRWVTQVGAPGWFDDTIEPFKTEATQAAGEALDAVAHRIDERTKG